jgi:hypothetical protein
MTDAACAILSTATKGALAASVRPLMGRGGSTIFAVEEVGDDISTLDTFFCKLKKGLKKNEYQSEDCD